MTTWTDINTIETGWTVGDGFNQDVALLFDNALPYNIDYVAYDGYYVEGNTDWATGTQLETAWKE
jgi:hypothetical protein